MKKYLIIALLPLLFLTGCENVQTIPQEVDLSDPSDVPDGEYDPLEDFEPDLEQDEETLYSGNCLFTYGRMIVGEDLPADSREWEGYHKLGNEVGKVSTRMQFFSGGNIKMYTKPMDIEDWELVKDFNVDRMKVPTDDENIDDIIEFPKASSHCLFEDTEENASKDFPCITLYPEGAPISEASPFNVNICVDTAGSMTVNMLKHTFYLSN
jgi:hypothetical protein